MTVSERQRANNQHIMTTSAYRGFSGQEAS